MSRTEKITEKIRDILAKYDEIARERLENATEKDYWICATSVNPAIQTEMELVEDKCTICGAKVYRRPFRSKAKVICVDCYKNIVCGNSKAC